MPHNKERGNLLLGFYGNLLNDHQLEILNDYFVDDLSMQEIADNHEVSKAAISDIINRSLIQLNDYDNKLELIKQADIIDNLIEKMKKDEKIDLKYIKELEKINRG